MARERLIARKIALLLTASIAAGGVAASACSSTPGFQDDGSDGNLGDGLSLGGAGNDEASNVGGGSSCAESTASADLVPANLLFVVDKSGSMNCNAPPTDPSCTVPQKVSSSEPSKWEITQDALTGPSGALQTLAGQVGVSVGLINFPLDDNCEVPASGDVTVPIAALDADQLEAIEAGLDVTADGQTPLAGAAIRGLEALRLGIHAGELEGKNYLVVMTDGSETCQVSALPDLLEFVEEAEKYYSIKTYAIGAPGSEGSRALLSRIAVLGGTRKSDSCEQDPGDASESCHIDLTESDDFESDLGSEFQDITEATTQLCEYDVPTNALIDRAKVNVEYTPGGGEKELVPQDPPNAGDAQCEGAQGWQYAEDGSKIVLCGQICDDILADPKATVRVVFGCRETVVR